MTDALILAFDTSAAHCAAALSQGGALIGHCREDMRKGQAERLFPMLEDLLSRHGASWSDLTALGVGVGPGNFTGIRIAVSSARGLAMGLNIPAFGVSAFEALALGIDGPVLALVPATAGNCYVQRLDGGDRSLAHLITGTDVPTAFCAPSPTCVGYQSDDLAAAIGAQSATPQYDTAQAIALIAHLRAVAGETPDAPAPMYIRPADAAPASDPPPVILDA